jgi:hypothetical protein
VAARVTTARAARRERRLWAMSPLLGFSTGGERSEMRWAVAGAEWRVLNCCGNPFFWISLVLLVLHGNQINLWLCGCESGLAYCFISRFSNWQ